MDRGRKSADSCVRKEEEAMTLQNVPTPCYVVDEKKLKENLTILNRLERESGCHVLLAQKAFSMFSLYPLIGQYISGTTASGLYEARLGYEEMGKENHVYAPAYKDADMKELVTLCDHIVFNSFAQYEKHKETIKNYCSIHDKRSVSDCGSIRSVPHRRGMPSMTHAQRDQDLGSYGVSLEKNCRMASRDFISIRYASRMQMT